MEVDKQNFLKLVDEAEEVYFPIQVGKVSACLPVKKESIRDLLKIWDSKEIGKIETQWERDGTRLVCLDLYKRA
jgi:hypothetical protein